MINSTNSSAQAPAPNHLNLKIQILAPVGDTIFQTSPNPCLVIEADTQSTVVNVNEAYLKAMATNKDAVLEKSIFDIFPHSSENESGNPIQCLRDSILQVVQNRQADSMKTQKYFLPKTNGKESDREERYWRSVNSPIFDEKGNVSLIAHHITDVTEFISISPQKDGELKIPARRNSTVTISTAQKDEEEQQRRVREAEENRQKMEDFVDTLCHELRNPANGIYGNVSLLEMLVPSLERMEQPRRSHSSEAKEASEGSILADVKEAIASIDTCVKYQKTLLDDILHVSKLASGKVRLQEVECDPKLLVRDTVNMFMADINRKNLQLSTLLPKTELLIKADPDRLVQILTNLLSNAIKFTSPNGAIKVALEPASQKTDEVELGFSIEDTGRGMTKEEQSKLFNRFEQVGRSTSPEYGGSGLGLVICKSLVALMKGNIQIESEKSKGTKVCFAIRCALAKPSKKFEGQEVKKEKTSSIDNSSSRRNALNILVVEDNLINQRLLVKLLERLGHRCSVANNGQEAVNLVNQVTTSDRIPFDAILMDIEMPVMDGLEAAAKVREKEKRLHTSISVPIIALSGYSSEEYNKRTRSVGMNDFITKPYEINKVEDKLQEWVEKSKNDNASKTAGFIFPNPVRTEIMPWLSSSLSCFFGQSSSSMGSSSHRCEARQNQKEQNSKLAVTHRAA